MNNKYSWPSFFNALRNDFTFMDLMDQIEYEYSIHECYPPKEHIFDAFKLCSFEDIRVVIVGQDPYINKNQAHGLAFSVQPGVPIPPSLQNIFKELEDDLKCTIPNNGCLIPWAKQGVFLINSILTVEAGKSKSHAKFGWQTVTDRAIKYLSDYKDSGIVFMLWGNYAKSKKSLIDANKHLILEAAHPSPLAGGAFFGCQHFSKANQFLYEIYPSVIDWQIPNI